MVVVYYIPQTHHTATFFPEKVRPYISEIQFQPLNCPGIILKITLLHYIQAQH